MADDNGLPEIDDDLKMMMSSREHYEAQSRIDKIRSGSNVHHTDEFGDMDEAAVSRARSRAAYSGRATGMGGEYKSGVSGVLIAAIVAIVIVAAIVIAVVLLR